MYYVYPALQNNQLVVGVYNAEAVQQNFPPVITASNTYTVNEGVAFSAPITITNMDGAQPTLSGADSGLFSIVSTGGDSYSLTMTAKNFEAPADANSDNAYQVTIVANDGVNPSVTFDITITVLDVNEGFWDLAPPSKRIVRFS